MSRKSRVELQGGRSRIKIYNWRRGFFRNPEIFDDYVTKAEYERLREQALMSGFSISEWGAHERAMDRIFGVL